VVGVDGDPTRVPGMLQLERGRWLRSPQDVVLGRTLARDKHLDLGDQIRLGGSTFTVAGIGKLRGFSVFGQDAVAYLPQTTLASQAGLGETLNVIAIQTDRPTEIRTRLAELGGLATRTPAELVADAQQASASGIAIDWMLIVLTLGIAGLFVATMLNNSVAERRGEFALLRAIGVPAASIVLTVALEALAVTVIAGLFGVVLSLGFGWLIDHFVAAQYGFDTLYRADPVLFLTVFGLAALLGFAAGVVPARRAATVDPVLVLREA
jgi:putative ABC transport system permease protein